LNAIFPRSDVFLEKCKIFNIDVTAYEGRGFAPKAPPVYQFLHRHIDDQSVHTPVPHFSQFDHAVGN
jgi:hypothetical protein